EPALVAHGTIPLLVVVRVVRGVLRLPAPLHATEPTHAFFGHGRSGLVSQRRARGQPPLRERDELSPADPQLSERPHATSPAYAFFGHARSGIVWRQPPLRKRHEQSTGPPATGYAISSLTIPSSTRTANVATGSTAGSVRGMPVRMSMFAPWRGQIATPVSGSKSPSHSGPSSCEQQSAMA